MRLYSLSDPDNTRLRLRSLADVRDRYTSIHDCDGFWSSYASFEALVGLCNNGVSTRLVSERWTFSERTRKTDFTCTVWRTSSIRRTRPTQHDTIVSITPYNICIKTTSLICRTMIDAGGNISLPAMSAQTRFRPNTLAPQYWGTPARQIAKSRFPR